MAPNNSKDKWVRRFLITETSRHKKGFTVYKVTSVIFPKAAPEAVSRVSIWKRYNDFRKLHSELSSRHDSLRIKEPFPPFPKPKFFGRFEAEVIQERRQCAIRLLEFIGRHTALFTSNVFVKFFESENSKDYSTTDCSLSLSSDTSEDDHNLNSALKGTNYLPTPVSDNEINRDSSGVNVSNEKCILDTNSPSENFHTDNSALDLSKNNNYIDVIDSRANKAPDISKSEPNDNKSNKESSQTELLPQIQVHDGSDLPVAAEEDSSSYILVAAAHMSAAFRHEALGEFEEAFTQYKLGISNLLNGVQADPDRTRRNTVKDKISKYLERAERLYNRHLNCNVSVLHKPVAELQNYKVLRVMGSVMLVRDIERDCNRVIKTVQKPAASTESLSDYILRGKIPFMVRLYGCIETESTVFLVLQHASGGKLWEYMKSYYKGRNEASNWCEKGHARSASCEAIIQSEVKGIESPKLEEPSRRDITDFSLDEIDSPIDPAESLKKLEEEFGGNSVNAKTSPTTDLVAKSQELLRSVDATLKKSNSIATRLNEAESLLYFQKETLIGTENSIEVVSREKSTIEKQEEPETEKMAKAAKKMNPHGVKVKVGLEKPNEELFSADKFQSLVAEDSGIEMDDELWKLPEGTIRFWAAEILATLESLHQQDVIVADLKPDNILLGNGGHVAMSYIVPRSNFEFLKLKKPYSAPELCMFSPTVPPSTAADVWSFGVLLYELFTGTQFQAKHPGPFHSHSILNIPEELSVNVKSLISSVLRYKPEERLTIPEIKEHQFFSSIDWNSLINSCFT